MTIAAYPEVDIITQPPTVGAKVTRSAQGSYGTSGNWEYVSWDTLVFDSDGMRDPVNTTRLYARTPGKYFVYGRIHWLSNASASRRDIIFRKNGTTTIDGLGGTPLASQEFSTVAFQVIDLAAGDYIELGIYSGVNNLQFYGSEHLSHFGMVLLSGNANGLPSGARVERATAQTGLASGAWTPITFTSVVSDSDALWNGATRLYARKSGWYVASGFTTLTSPNTTGSYRIARLRLNDTKALVEVEGPVKASDIRFGPTSIVFLRAGDYVTLEVYHDSGTPAVTSAGANYETALELVCITGTTVSTRPAPTASLHRTTATSALTANTWTPILLTVAEWDTDRFFDSVAGWFVCRIPGTYEFHARAHFAAGTGLRQLGIVKNENYNPVSAGWESESSVDLATSRAAVLSTSTVLRMNVGDVVRLHALTSTSLAVTSAQLRAVLVEPVSQAAIMAPEAWRVIGAAGEPAFNGAWVNFDATTFPPARFYKDPSGIVRLEGLVKTGTIGTHIFDLPVGYRPEKWLHIATASNGAFGMLEITGVNHATTPGRVVASAGNSAWFSLSGIEFRAA